MQLGHTTKQAGLEMAIRTIQLCTRTKISRYLRKMAARLMIAPAAGSQQYTTKTKLAMIQDLFAAVYVTKRPGTQYRSCGQCGGE